jgi:hypothetical protein
MANVIYAGPIGSEPQYAEAKAGAEGILPGSLLIKSAGDFVVHDAEGQGGPFYIANKDTLSQTGVDAEYTEGDTVFAFDPAPTELFYVRVAEGENVTALDTALTSDGAGALKIAADDGSEEVVAYAQEIENFTSAGGLLRVKIATSGYNALGGA